jgi:microcin C transport system permease protein
MASKPNQPSPSLLAKRWRKFKTIKRGYYALLILFFTYTLSFLLPLFVGNTALIVRHEGKTWFPLFQNYISAADLGQDRIGSADYRALQAQFKAEGGDSWVLMPMYPYGPKEACWTWKAPRPTAPAADTCWAPTTVPVTCSPGCCTGTARRSPSR